MSEFELKLLEALEKISQSISSDKKNQDAVEEAIKQEWEEIHRWKPSLHFCVDWDGLLIDRYDLEFASCLCFENKSKI